ncbi:MAG TPA: hypothetical protein P5092_04635 [Ruminococcus sp.]|nr:hypothetical protein [Ruminococcus sp.]
MKKFIIIALVSLMTLTSCKNNNKDSSSEQISADTAATTSADTVQAEKSTETGKSTSTESSPEANSTTIESQASDSAEEPAEFIELAENSFSEVTINVTHTDNEPPFEIHSLDLSDLDFGTRETPCRTEKIRDPYWEASPDDPEYEEKCREYDEGHAGPDKPRLASYAFDGDTLYLSVLYDDYCYNSHCTVIYSVDAVTKQMTEITELKGTDRDYSVYNLFCVRDKLIGVMYADDQGELVEINKENGSITTLYKSDFDHIHDCDGERVLLVGFVRDIIDSYSYVQEYDMDSGELTMIAPHVDSNEPPMLYGKGTARLEKNEDRTYSVVTDDYRIDTGLRGLRLISAHERDCTVISQDELLGAGRSVLYHYDIDRGERHMLQLTSANTGYFDVGKGIMGFSQGGRLLTAVPDIGQIFEKEVKGVFGWYSEYSGGYTMLTIDYPAANGNIGSHTMPTELFWIDKE